MWYVVSALILFLLVASFGVYVLGMYNRLTQLQTRRRQQFDRIETHLQRRHDLLPTLLEIAEYVLEDEEELLQQVTDTVTRVREELESVPEPPDTPETIRTLERLENQLSDELERLLTILDDHPDLREDNRMTQVLDVLSTTEQKLSFACEAYNEASTSYNDFRESFPPILFASLLGHSRNAVKLKLENLEPMEKTTDVYF